MYWYDPATVKQFLKDAPERLTKELVENTSLDLLKKRIGKELKTNTNPQFDYIDDLVKRYDQMGNLNMIPHWDKQRSQFFSQIERHIDKADYTVIDLSGFPDNIKKEVADYILNLSESKFDKIIPIGF